MESNKIILGEMYHDKVTGFCGRATQIIHYQAAATAVDLSALSKNMVVKTRLFVKTRLGAGPTPAENEYQAPSTTKKEEIEITEIPEISFGKMYHDKVTGVCGYATAIAYILDNTPSICLERLGDDMGKKNDWIDGPRLVPGPTPIKK